MIYKEFRYLISYLENFRIFSLESWWKKFEQKLTIIRPPAEKQHRKEAMWPYIWPCRFLQIFRFNRVFFPKYWQSQSGKNGWQMILDWPQDIPPLLYAFVSIRPRVLSKDKICTSLGSLFNLHLLLNEHAPVSQQTPSATQFPWLRLPQGGPEMAHASVLSFSFSHMLDSDVPIWQPKGPQQISGPTHWPKSPGPHDIHSLVGWDTIPMLLLPPGGQFRMKQQLLNVVNMSKRRLTCGKFKWKILQHSMFCIKWVKFNTKRCSQFDECRYSGTGITIQTAIASQGIVYEILC